MMVIKTAICSYNKMTVIIVILSNSPFSRLFKHTIRLCQDIFYNKKYKKWHMLLTNEALQSIKTQIVIEVSLYGLVNLTLVFSYKYLVYIPNWPR
jgi:hypothetical protein